MNEHEMRELFREMRDEPVPADSLARLRIGVDQRLRKRSWAGVWKIAAALTVVGCVVAGFLLLRPARISVPVQQPGTPEIAQVITPPEVPVQAVAPPKRIRQSRRVQTLPVMIRIETPDPEVVILLVN